MARRGRQTTENYEITAVVAEPTRTSIYDILLNNFEIAKRVTYLHRLIYVGEHNFPQTSIVDAFEDVCQRTNAVYYTERMTGVLLYYDTYFCHMVEASEGTLNRHLCNLFDDYGSRIRNVKLVTTMHHVKLRFTNSWIFYRGKPSQRVEEIDPESDLENSMRYIRECCEKLYRFAKAYVEDCFSDRGEVVEYEEPEDHERGKRDSTIPIVKLKTKTLLEQQKAIVDRDPYYELLPELKLLNFLINCKFLRDLINYKDFYGHVTRSHDFTSKVWPAPYNFVPYNVFDTPYEPIEDLLTAGGQESVKEDDITLEAEEEDAENKQ